MSLSSEKFRRVLFNLEMPPFDTYLETVSEFLEIETRKYHRELAEEQSKPDKIVPTDMPEQAAYEEVYESRQYEEHLRFRLGTIDEFENILLKSFFVSIYSFLEEYLTSRCEKVKDQNNFAELLWSKWKKKKENDGPTIKKALLYLVSTRQIDSSSEHSAEWEKILCYVRLRNCIVHDEGKVNEDTDKELMKCISQEGSKVLLNERNIVLTKEFCKNAWKTIEEFLWLVSQAEIQVKE